MKKGTQEIKRAFQKLRKIKILGKAFRVHFCNWCITLYNEDYLTTGIFHNVAHLREVPRFISNNWFD